MKKNTDPVKISPTFPSVHFRLVRILLVACLFVVFIALLFRAHHKNPTLTSTTNSAAEARASDDSRAIERPPSFPNRSNIRPAQTAEEIVSGKLAQFTQSRRKLARLTARRKGVEVPAEVERFFDTLERGRWEEIEKEFKALADRSGQYDGGTKPAPELNPVWNAVLDAYGVAEQVHEWPAQKLLDYGDSILAALRPGMVYVGGTDSGRWIPELLNDTSGRE